MGLKNYQYSKILRDYDEKQLRNKHELERRTKIAYSKIPKLKEIDDSIITVAMKSAKTLLANFDNQDSIDKLKEAAKSAKLKRRTLLKEHGFPEDYLELQYQCTSCMDTGFIGSDKCHCFKQAIVNVLYSQSNIKSAVSKENFSNFSFDYYPNNYIDESIGLTPRQNIEKVVDQAKAFIRNFGTSFENLLIYGNTGVGKTFLTNCIAKELLDSSYTVIYLTAFQLFDILEKNKFQKDGENEEVESQFNYILDCDLLIVDDLGTELTNSFINTQLYLCINERYLREKSTIISTNLSLDNINAKYSERIFSRIISNYTLLKIVGDDIRLQKCI
ncbi:MAG: ATP-binding protein [Clostridiales bacterium]|nr:ATP-binding protein [Clostridiales bacterium]